VKKNRAVAARTSIDPEYDFSRGQRGEYAGRYAGGSNVVVLDPSVAKIFLDSASVNDALRGLVRIADCSRKAHPR